MGGKKSDQDRSPKQEPASAAIERSEQVPDGPFPIVGIGASAGGLEALERFFAHAPASAGMAYAIIQHLDPTREGMMPELLQRCTAMPVLQVEDRTPIQKDHVYVIPPNKDIKLSPGTWGAPSPTSPRASAILN